MRILTDSPARLSAALGLQENWQLQSAASLPAQDLRLWRALAAGPDCWVAERTAVGSVCLWSRVFLIDRAPASQLDVLRATFASGPPLDAPVACLALSGDGFHGHRGRPWVTAEGNLHLSVAFPGAACGARQDLALTMLPAVAVVSALAAASAGTLQAGIKWVNDILIDERKVAGVLTSTVAAGDCLALVAMGIGLNVACAVQVPPSPFVPATGCLAEHPRALDLSLAKMVWAILAAVANHTLLLARQGPSPILQRYRAASLVLGRRVRVWPDEMDETMPMVNWPPPLACGRVRAIAADLSLQLAGRWEPVTRGRLAFENVCRAFRL